MAQNYSCGTGIGQARRVISGDVAMASRQLAEARWAELQALRGLGPERCQAEIVTFKGTFGVTTTTQPSAVKVPSGYDFVMHGIQGFIQAFSDFPENFRLLTVNLKNQGMHRNVWLTDINMAQLLTERGPAEPLIFPAGSHYLFPTGADLQVTFTKATGWTGADKDVGIVLLGQLIAAQ